MDWGKNIKLMSYLLTCAQNNLSIVHGRLFYAEAMIHICFMFVKVNTLMCASISESGQDNSVTTSSLTVL